AAALDELARLLGLPKPPVLIECFDISHTAGSAMVAGMVVFENGRPLKKMYKRFQIDTPPADDYAAMRDVVARRLAHKDDSAFGPLPDLLLVDGGKGHVAAVKSVLGDAQIPVFGLVKDERHRTRAVAGEQEIVIAANRRVFTLLSAIQEEVHRFAIAYHHKKTQKNTLTTALTSLDGVGPVLTKALLQHFGSLKKIKEASAVELCAVRGVSKQRAEKLVGQLKEIEI
ncbi:MAG: helix-hairpin-helix domain-containing protein, partial [Oscillospiraceae bacterium]|nr:helix-hairpin-helix domain-containing protein [Oscillospiraceae bacterium]